MRDKNYLWLTLQVSVTDLDYKEIEKFVQHESKSETIPRREEIEEFIADKLRAMIRRDIGTAPGVMVGKREHKGKADGSV